MLFTFCLFPASQQMGLWPQLTLLKLAYLKTTSNLNDLTPPLLFALPPGFTMVPTVTPHLDLFYPQ